MIELTNEFYNKLVLFRRDLHEYPELSFKEYNTTKKIIEWLKEYGIESKDFGLETGVVFDIKGDLDGDMIALRADIDALPILEDTNFDFKSKVNGVMHACGHDFHTASILGTAVLIHQNKDKLKGTVRIIFQPSEENARGAKYMVKHGVLDGVKYIFGMHNSPELKVGSIGVKAGPLMAGVDRFEIKFKGRGGHAGMPHKSIDPIIMASSYVTSIQSIISRKVSLFDNAVISITHINGGNTWNVIPDDVYIEGTVRTFQNDSREIIKKSMKTMAVNIALANDGDVEFNWEYMLPVVDNDESLLTFVTDTIEDLGYNIIKATPNAGGEDFSFYQLSIPGFFVFVGVDGRYPWHSNHFELDEKAIKSAVEYFSNLAFRVLK